jgi:pyruvate/2-oxoglutarate dehydrogenase complex dihydrolipoamide acyltransferase (E2) component
VARPVATLSLSADHRVYSGATAARFLAAIKAGIESPLLMLAGVTAPADRRA